MIQLPIKSSINRREESELLADGIERKRAKYGYIFALPWIMGLLLLYAYPLVSSIYYSFTKYNVVSPAYWVGFDNYIQLFWDPVFWVGIKNTLYYAAISVPLSVVLGIFLAMLLNTPIKGQGIFRTIFFIPTLVPVVATSIIWQWLLNPQFGLVNQLLAMAGINGPPWLGDPKWSKPSLILMAQWGIGNSIIIYLAGLQDISKDYDDAASVDGASGLRKVWSITLPLLTPVIFFNMVMGIINALQVFTLPYALTYGTGNPANSLLFYSMYLYNNAFKYMNMGYASAMAWILFIVIMAITLLLFRSSNRWVYY
ncbi:MAG: sugar ABC transporter permease, partial [Caldicoprobacterales bacterium]